MSEQHIESRMRIKAPASIIWEALADIRSWPSWSPNDAAFLERPGSPDPNGVGAVRMLRSGKFTVRERVVAFEPERRVGYRLISGLPVRDHVTEVILSPSDDGTLTDVVWRVAFKPKIPLTGKWANSRLTETINEWSAALARHAEKAAAERGS